MLTWGANEKPDISLVGDTLLLFNSIFNLLISLKNIGSFHFADKFNCSTIYDHQIHAGPDILLLLLNTFLLLATLVALHFTPVSERGAGQSFGLA